MRIITGDECGLLKETIPELSRCDDGSLSGGRSGGISQPAVDEGVSRLNLEDPMTRSKGIVDMSFVIGKSKDEDSCLYEQFCTLRVDGSVEQWKKRPNNHNNNNKRYDYMSAGQYSRIHTWDDVFLSQNDNDDDDGNKERQGRTVAMVGCSKTSVLACATSMGKVSLLNTTHLNEDGIVAQYDAFQVKDNNSKITLTKGNFENRDICTAMAMDFHGQRLALGGRERETILLDMETGKQLWKAKNLKRDAQTLLEQPIWGTAIEFVRNHDGADDNNNNGNSNLLVVGTAYKELRVYDVRANSIQRRPIMHSTGGDVVPHRITAICHLAKQRSVVVGDAAGYMQMMDMRQWDRGPVGRFNGPSGSVRQIIAHPTLDILACVGLDRMLRTYNTNNRKMIDCVYLKQRLNTLLFYPDPTWDNTTTDTNNDNPFQNHNMVSDDNDEIMGNIDEEDDVQDYVNSSDDDDDENENELPTTPRSKLSIPNKKKMKPSSTSNNEDMGSSSEEEDDEDEESDDDFESESDDESDESSSEEEESSPIPAAKRRRS